MKEPEKIPLDPSTPRAKSVSSKSIKPLKQTHSSEKYFTPDNDSIYQEIDNNENIKESHKS